MQTAKLLAFLSFLIAPAIVHAAECDNKPGYYVNDAGECVTHCNPGYYVPTPGAQCTRVTQPGNHYVDTAHDVKYGETSTNMLKQCPSTADGRIGFIPDSTLSWIGTSIDSCILFVSGLSFSRSNCVANPSVVTECTYETHGVGTAPCYYTTGDDGAAIYDNRHTDPATGASRNICVGGSTLTACDAGWYASVIESPRGLQHHPCAPVGTGYWSPAGDLKRYPCPANTATCGWGDCAASADDCKPYRTLHTSTGVELMLQPRQRMSPALAVRMPDDTVWYSLSDAGARDDHVNIEYNGAPHALVNPLDLFLSYPEGIVVPVRPGLLP